jgi:glycosyltransferase involved in cell wall biosynthesis
MDYRGLKVALLVAQAPSGQAGGAERLYEGLERGLSQLGAVPTVVPVSADEPTFEQIIANYEACARLDLSGFDAVISTKAPTFAVDHPNHVVYLVHTIRVFDDMFDTNFPSPNETLLQQRAEIHRRDFESLSKAKARFAIGHEVARRLYALRGLQAGVLHPPLTTTGFQSSGNKGYFFLPGRLHPWKRVDLLIKAIKESSLPLRFFIAGTGEASSELEKLAGSDERIKFLGRISDDALLSHYASCLAVPFVPIREDYGYITLEAFASGKPVVTCRDSGEPCFFVKHKENGLLCDPTVASVREALEWLWKNQEAAVKMGSNGKKVTEAMSWKDTAAQLLSAAISEVPTVKAKRKTAAVLDMQPIDPPVGGGRLRLLGLYHSLDQRFDCNYVGSYDWPGEKRRDHFLTPTLREVTVPLSKEHHAAASKASSDCGGKVVIDIAFSRQGHLSQNYLSAACNEIAKAEIVIFSHPWIYPLVKEYLRPHQVVVYDSQNVEGYLRAQLLDESNPAEAELLKQVVSDELELGRRADWILVCSHEDLSKFGSIYGLSSSKMRVVPNGVMAFGQNLPSPGARSAARERLGLPMDARVALFIGSNYGPNVQAAHFITDQLAKELSDWTFVIAGGVGQSTTPQTDNVIVTGPISNEQKTDWLSAANAGINPMTSGSGTNIKMFDFMAASLPTVTTLVGARGIDYGNLQPLVFAEAIAKSFAEELGALNDESKARQIGQDARLCVEKHYAWERISELLGVFLEARTKRGNQQKPLFSIIVIARNGGNKLTETIQRLHQQIERDFEVIVIDQTDIRWPERINAHPFPLVYYRASTKCSCKARNDGAFLSSGRILAFTNDECKPAPNWLSSARIHFSDSEIIGIEGRLRSAKDYTIDQPAEEDFPPLAGIMFDPANLFVKSSAFQLLGGWNTKSKRPHYRAESDFGTRLQSLGPSPYQDDVQVVQWKSDHAANETPARESYITKPREQKIDLRKWRIAHLSTTGIKCGIGQYTKELIDQYSLEGHSNLLLNCAAVEFETDALPNDVVTRKVWYYDNKHYRDSYIDVDEAQIHINFFSPDFIVLQYHQAFFSPSELIKFAISCTNTSARIICVIHNYHESLNECLQILRWFNITVITLRKSDVSRAFAHDIAMWHVPLGVCQAEIPRNPSLLKRDWSSDPPKIVTNGFFREHKGIRKLIEAMPIIKAQFPRIH